MKKIILFLLLAINSYGQKKINNDSLISKATFEKAISLQKDNFENKIKSISADFSSKNRNLPANSFLYQMAYLINLPIHNGWHLRIVLVFSQKRLTVYILLLTHPF